MPDFADGAITTWPITASNTLFAWALVRVVSGSLTLCGAGDTPDGYVDPSYDGNTSYAPMVQRKAARIPLGKADAAITSGVPVYAGASGTISATATGPCLGVALEAATAANDEIKYLPRVGVPDVFRAVADGTAVHDSSTETTTYSFSIPANRLRAGTRIRCFGEVKATATVSTDTLRAKITIGSNVVCDTGTVDVADNDYGVLNAEATIRTSGASGTIVGAGSSVLKTTAASTGLDSTTIDTTAAVVVAMTLKWSTTNANSALGKQFSVAIID